jgi:hypothetical protein
MSVEVYGDHDKYCVVKGRWLSEVTHKVNELIEKGWKPKGGIAVADRCYVQAMIDE